MRCVLTRHYMASHADVDPLTLHRSIKHGMYVGYGMDSRAHWWRLQEEERAILVRRRYHSCIGLAELDVSMVPGQRIVCYLKPLKVFERLRALLQARGQELHCSPPSSWDTHIRSSTRLPTDCSSPPTQTRRRRRVR